MDAMSDILFFAALAYIFVSVGATIAAITGL